MSTTDLGTSSSGTSAPERTAFRPDIEGLRGISIAAILLFHAGLPFVPGGFIGVDVFFVLSGFLITGLIVREVTSTGTLRLGAFWGRRARRLLPAAGLVLVCTGIASIFLLPHVGSRAVSFDIIAAAVYAANILFATTSADYFADSGYPSPVLHFWSLGVEEQFYLTWPVLLLVITMAFGVRRAFAASSDVRKRTISVTAVVLVTVFLGSLALSLWLTVVNQPWAFFSMPTRAWEFAIGGLISLGVPLLARIPLVLRVILGWLGLAAIVAAAVTLDGSTPYPGVAALIPVLGTGAIVIAGIGAMGWGPSRLLVTRPMRAVGRVSYSWYLWHWPVLILLSVGLELEGLRWSLALVAASWIPAYLAYRFVETPMRTASWAVGSTRRSLQLGLVASLVGVVGGVALLVVPVSTSIDASAAGSGKQGSALAPTPGPSGTITPSLDAAADDLWQKHATCHLGFKPTDLPTDCVLGMPNGARTVILFGDSHAGHWTPALVEAGSTRGWRVETYTKASCPAPIVQTWSSVFGRSYTECDAFRQNFLNYLSGLSGDRVVVAASTRDRRLLDANGKSPGVAAQNAMWTKGWRAFADAVRKTGAVLVIVHDSPRLPENALICLSRHLGDPRACDVKRSEVVAPPSIDIAIAKKMKGVVGVDLTDGLCYVDVCPVVRANLLVYRDDAHLTATYSRALGAGVGAILDRAIAAAQAEVRGSGS